MTSAISLASQCITLPTLLLVLVAKDERLPKTEFRKFMKDEKKKPTDLADCLFLEKEDRIHVLLKFLSELNSNLTSFLRSKQ